MEVLRGDIVRRGWAWLLLAVAFGFSACEGTETGNPSLDGDLRVVTDPFDPTNVPLAQAGEVVTVTSAWIAVKGASLIEGAACDQGRSALDMAAPSWLQIVKGEQTLPFRAAASAYCGVDLEVSTDVPAGTAPSELEGLAMRVEGTRTDGSAFVLESRARSTVRIRPASPLELRSGTPDLVVSMDVRAWFNGADLRAATGEAGQALRIDETSNTDVLHAFEANVIGSADAEAVPDSGVLSPVVAVPQFEFESVPFDGVGPTELNDDVVAAQLVGSDALDLAFIDHTNLQVHIYERNGSFSFTNTLDLPTHWLPRRIMSGDFDEDGRTDLVVGNGAGTYPLDLFFNRSGSFERVSLDPEGMRTTNVSDLEVGDFNEDGRPDIVAMDDYLSRPLSVFLNHGGGVLGISGLADRLITHPFNFSYGLESGDFNGDGHVDLALLGAVNISTRRTRMAFIDGNGDGTFQPVRDAEIDASLVLLEAARFGAGEDDVVSINVGQSQVEPNLGVEIVHIRRAADGTPIIHARIPVTHQAQWVEVSDLDQDGLQDLLVFGQDPATDTPLWIYRGRAERIFYSPSKIVAPAGVRESAVLDLDEPPDGLLDIAAFRFDQHQLHFFRQKGVAP